MSWIDKSVMTEPRLLAMLGPGERLLATASVGPAMSGVERIIESPPPPPPPAPPHAPASGAERVVLGAAFVAAAAIAPTGWSGGELPLRLLGGTRVLGTPTSAGVSLFRTLVGGTALKLVLTDRRLLVVEGGKSSWIEDPNRPGKRKLAGEYRALADFPRGSLVAARRKGRLGARGRVELYFDDGSMVALMTGILLTAPARRILRTLALPRSPSFDPPPARPLR
ncbi:MAG: hypothetical protein M3Y44_12195 [Actinomycetota bacterium]|nr:hypothetical protein [Actinomycetota bacterium]